MNAAVPLVPCTLTMYDPAADPTQLNVEFRFGSVVNDTLVGLREHESPVLEGLLVKVTVPVNESTGLTVMIEEPDTPENIGATVAGVAVKEKSGATVTDTTIAGEVCLLLPSEVALITA